MTTELALSIVLQNTYAFKELEKSHCKNILGVFHKDTIELSENIKKFIIKYKCEDLYEKIHSNIIKFVFAAKKNETKNLLEIQKRRKELLIQAKSSDIKDDFKMLIISNMKEEMFECMYDSCYSMIDSDILQHIITIVNKLYDPDDIINHHHDIHHILFKNKSYSFYDLCESKNISIIKKYYSMEDDIEDIFTITI